MREDVDHEIQIPHLFRCPISLDVFTDPVTLSTGQTYDRPNIERWLQLGNLTCPVTMQPLHDPSLVPNHTLRHLIEQYWSSSKVGPLAVDPDHPVITLRHQLESDNTRITLIDRIHTIRKVRALSNESPSRCSHLIQLGFLPVMMELIFGEMLDHLKLSEKLMVVEEALACAIKLLDASVEPESSQTLSMLRKDSKLASFCGLFQQGDSMIKASLCRLVEAICSSSSCFETREISTLLVENVNFSHELILLLYRNDEASEAGLRAIRALWSIELNRSGLVRSGLIDGLIANIDDATQVMGLVVLEQILQEHEKAREEVVNHQNGIKTLVKMVFRVSDLEGSGTAVNCLTIMCEGSVRAREEAVGFGVLTQLLLLLQSQCSGRTKARARVLLKLLRSKQAR